MGGKDTSYQIVYRGETLKHFKPGQCVFFQRERQYGGGYWLGKTHVDGFEFLLEQPTSLREGMLFLLTLAKVEARHMEFVDFDQFNLTQSLLGIDHVQQQSCNVRFERGADLELLYTLKSEWYCYRDAYRRIEDWAEQNLPPEPTVYQEGYCQ